MPEHKMLVSHPASQSEMERSQMAGASSGSPGSKRGHVSVFGRGRAARGVTARFDPSDGRESHVSLAEFARHNPARTWDSLTAVKLDGDHLVGNGLFPGGVADAANGLAARAFDTLRTRLLQTMAERGWTRLAITSPTHGCGKTLVAANLALGLARRAHSRTVLVDLDLRRPSLADMLGVADVPPLSEFLSGDQPLESHFRRFGQTLALGLNSQPVTRASDLLLDPDTSEVLDDMHDRLEPEMVLFDLPPALVCDDLMAMRGHIDAVLLVADGTRSSPADIRACEKLFDGSLPLLGVVLNRAQDSSLGRYRYGRD